MTGAFVVADADAGLRTDVFLTRRLEGISRSRVQSAIRAGVVLHNGFPARASAVVAAGDSLFWQPPPQQECGPTEPEALPLEILHEDEWLLVVNKEAGVVVHPGAGHSRGTLVAGLLHHCRSLSSLGGADRPGIVHRLDKETSGCLLVAKTDEVHASLGGMFARREIRKTYLALVAGRLKKPAGSIEAPIARHPVHRQRMAVAREGRGREALTHYRMLAMAGGISLIECHPFTGRTHQIRVHLTHLGCPILGDAVYGRRGTFSRHMLHAWRLSFQHPKTGSPISVTAPLPGEFRSAFPGMPEGL